MLVLSRRKAEKIRFPELGITLEIISVKGNTVRVGIDAPQEIRIMRGEVLDQDIAGETPKATRSNNRSSKAPDATPTAQPLAPYIRQGANQKQTPISATADATVRETQPGYQVCKRANEPAVAAANQTVAV
jgi:carbon storage regulator